MHESHWFKLLFLNDLFYNLRKITGTTHTAVATKVNRYEFALKLAETFNLNKNLIKTITMNEIKWKAKRPTDSSLNENKATTLLNHKPLKLEHAFEIMKKEKTRTGHKK